MYTISNYYIAKQFLHDQVTYHYSYLKSVFKVYNIYQLVYFLNTWNLVMLCYFCMVKTVVTITLLQFKLLFLIYFNS